MEGLKILLFLCVKYRYVDIDIIHKLLYNTLMILKFHGDRLIREKYVLKGTFLKGCKKRKE